jgi:hypothetical protein
MHVSAALLFRHDIDLAPGFNLAVLAIGVSLTASNDVVMILCTSTTAVAHPKDMK